MEQEFFELFKIIERMLYPKMDIKPNSCTHVARLTNEEKHMETNNNTLFSSLHRECVLIAALWVCSPL